MKPSNWCSRKSSHVLVFLWRAGRSSVMLWNPGFEVPNDWEKMVCSDTLLPLNAITGTGIDCSK